VEKTRAHAAAAASRADGLRALGDVGADADRQSEAADDSRFRRLPGGALHASLSGPGCAEIATRAVALLKESGITAGVDGCRGLDHGAWVPLRWMYPDADVPVAQLSVQPELGTAHHVELGRALAPLAREGVLIVGSGHTTHNLRDWSANPRRGEPLRYAQDFADWMHDRLLAHDTAALIAYRERAPDAARAHPTEEHFLPLFVAWGGAGREPAVEQIVDGFEAGALAMDSYLFRPSAKS